MGVKDHNTSAPSGIDILTQVTISGGRVITIAADFFPFAKRRLSTSETDEKVSTGGQMFHSRENGSELLKAGETKFGRLVLQRL